MLNLRSYTSIIPSLPHRKILLDQYSPSDPINVFKVCV